MTVSRSMYVAANGIVSFFLMTAFLHSVIQFSLSPSVQTGIISAAIIPSLFLISADGSFDPY